MDIIAVGNEPGDDGLSKYAGRSHDKDLHNDSSSSRSLLPVYFLKRPPGCQNIEEVQPFDESRPYRGLMNNEYYAAHHYHLTCSSPPLRVYRVEHNETSAIERILRHLWQ